MTITALTNDELLSGLIHLARTERESTVALIAHLGEFDRRRLFEGLGFGSTFKYCMEVLHLSEDAAYNRVEAARAARRYPQVLEMLASGALSSTTARLLGRYLTDENNGVLLASAAWKSKHEVEELLGRVFAPPAARASVRPVAPRSKKTQAGAPCAATPSAILAAPAPRGPVSAVASDRPIEPPGLPIAPRRYSIRVEVGAETYEKLRTAQDLLGHAVPSGDVAQVLDRALTALVRELGQRKFAAASGRTLGRPPTYAERSAVTKGSRHVPADVRREVWRRDGGRSAFVAQGGRRCDARRWIEFHHVRPFAAGGTATVANIQLRCRAHNGHEVDLFFGPGRRRTRTEGCGESPGQGHPFRNGTTRAERGAAAAAP